MKRFITIFSIITMFICTSMMVQASDYSRYSDNAKIKTAMNMLEKTDGQKTINAIKVTNTKIMFFDLSKISAEYADAHAMATSDDNGQEYILINKKHENAPAEAIACLLAHEATHQLAQTTMDEEIQAWTNEAQQWVKFKTINPNMNYKGELVNRLNRLADMYANKTTSAIAMAVKTNSNYVSLK